MSHPRILEARFGLDLGQTTDPSALVLIATTKPHHWQILSTRIFPLGTAYTDVALAVSDALQRFAAAHPSARLTLIADATGLGRPTLEILHQHLPQDVQLIGITFTATGKPRQLEHPTLPITLFHVPKPQLIEALVKAIESRHLTPVPNLPNKDILTTQLQSLRYTTNPRTRHTTITARHRKGSHADLAMALAMANWHCLESPLRIDERNTMNSTPRSDIAWQR
jgi:hypothetical protein